MRFTITGPPIFAHGSTERLLVDGADRVHRKVTGARPLLRRVEAGSAGVGGVSNFRMDPPKQA